VRTAFVTGGSGFIGGHLIRRLARDGWTVQALARSDGAAGRVTAAGSEPVRGDICDRAALERGARGAEVVFHLAAMAKEWGAWDDFRRVNVEGTKAVLNASRAAGVRRVVHVGTEAALMHGQPLIHVDERTPLALSSKAMYPATKAAAEAAVVSANGDGLETVAIRPRLVWGPGDTTLIPVMTEMIRSGRFHWIGGGRRLTSTTHVDNTVEGLVLAADHGTPGAAYFVTDGEPVEFRAFITELLAAHGVEAPGGTVPLRVAAAAAAVCETAWRALPLPGAPPVTRFAVWASGLECTLDISRARADLGYAPVMTREAGLAALRAG
jgi:nucleoside-diphosphate-sugar epimerase